MPDDLDDVLDDAASRPKKSTGDNGSVEEHPIQDLIALDRYNRAKARTGTGLRITKLRPGSASGEDA
jgi:hypothetical protein